MRAANRIVDHVGTLAVGRGLDCFAQVFRGVVDRRVGSMLLAGSELFIGRGGSDNARTKRLADFNRGQADTAGCVDINGDLSSLGGNVRQLFHDQRVG